MAIKRKKEEEEWNYKLRLIIPLDLQTTPRRQQHVVIAVQKGRNDSVSYSKLTEIGFNLPTVEHHDGDWRWWLKGLVVDIDTIVTKGE